MLPGLLFFVYSPKVLPCGGNGCTARAYPLLTTWCPWPELRANPGSLMGDLLKKLLVVAAVGAISFVFIVQFQPGSTDVSQVKSGSQCAAEAEGQCIVAQSDFITAVRMATPPNLDNDRIENRIRTLVMEGLVQRHLLLADAERLQVTVSDKAVTAHLAKGLARVSLPVDQEEYSYYIGLQGPPDGPARPMYVSDSKTGKFEYKRYTRWVSRVSTKTLKDFRVFQRKEAIAARMRSIVKSRVRISEAEARADYERKNEKIQVEYLKLERAWFAKYVLDASDEVVAKWVQGHKDDIAKSFKSSQETYLPGCRVARHILVRVDPTAEDKKAAKAAARAKLEKARKAIKKASDFAKVARKFSEDSASRAAGGALGCFAPGKLAKPATTQALDEAIHKLKKGDVSEIIETTFGLHLAIVDDVLDEKAAEAFGMDVVGKELYRKQEAERLAAEAGKKIRAAAAGGKKLEEALSIYLAETLRGDAKEAYEAGKAKAAEKKKGDEDEDEDESSAVNAWTDASRPAVAESDEFGLAGMPFFGIQNSGAARRELFSIAKVGDVAGDLVKLIDGYAVAKLMKKIPVTQKQWDEERVQHIAGLRREKQKDALTAYMHRLRTTLNKIEFLIAVTKKIDPKK